jgi:amino acid transporter
MKEKAANVGPDEAITSMPGYGGSQKSLPGSGSDIEKQVAPEGQQLQRKLKSRHLQFVAIGIYLLAGIHAVLVG